MEMHIVHKQVVETLDRPYAILSVLFHAGNSDPVLEQVIKGE